MTTAAPSRTTYPSVSATAWQTLRKKFDERPPTTPVNAAYLKAVLKFDTDDAGATLASSLKRIGIIDDKGVLTERAYRWRDDNQYKAVCEEIVEDVYPPALRDAFHSADTPLADVVRWFSNDTHKGLAAATKQARFYLMLLNGDASKSESESSPKRPSKAQKTSKHDTDTQTRRSKQREADAPSVVRQTADDHASAPEPNGADQSHRAGERIQRVHTVAPSVHLDFQIHIAPDSSPQIIDQIFESMAKHLRSLMSEVGD